MCRSEGLGGIFFKAWVHKTIARIVGTVWERIRRVMDVYFKLLDVGKGEFQYSFNRIVMINGGGP